MNWRIGILIIVTIALALTFAPVVPAVTLAQEDTFVLPEPTGPDQIGTVTYHWADETGREVIFRIWYPAEVEDGVTPEPYVNERPEWEYMERIASPYLNWQDVLEAESHAYSEAPGLSSDIPYPVVIFVHGHSVMPEVYTAYLENLASHGYVVAAYYTGSDAAGISIFALDQLEMLNTADPEGIFTGKLNLDRVGTIGHSAGSIPAIGIGVRDSRVKAVISLDGSLALAHSLEQPIMVFKRENFTKIESVQAAGPAYLINLKDFEHIDFLDVTFWPWTEPKSHISLDGYPFGSIHGVRACQIVNAYMLAFFDKYLKGDEQSLLDGPSDEYPEVEIESVNTE